MDSAISQNFVEYQEIYDNRFKFRKFVEEVYFWRGKSRDMQLCM